MVMFQFASFNHQRVPMTWTVAQLNGNTRRDSWRLLPPAIWKFATRHFQQSKRRFRTF